jgi:hypothetical protein
MRTLYKILPIVAFVLLFCACSDFLEEDPKGRLMQSNFFKNV